MATGFVHLGGRSEHSENESLASVSALVRAAASAGQESVALCDVMSLAGAPAFVAAARAAGLRPLLGLEARVLPWGATAIAGSLHRVRLLAANETGWRRLVRLVNLGQRRVGDGIPSHLSWADLLAEPEGLLYLVGGLKGEITAVAEKLNLERLQEIMRGLLEAVGDDRAFVALPVPGTLEGKRAARLLWTVAEEFNLAPVAVPEIHAATAGQALAWRALTPAPNRRAATLGDLVAPADQRPMICSTREIHEWFAGFPAAIENASLIAGLCQPSLMRTPRRFPVHEFERGVDADSFLWNEAFARANERYAGQSLRWRERLDREFRELADAHLLDALVTVRRIDDALGERGILRGPGAGFLAHSLVASLLGLTGIDPLAMDLPFVLPEGREQEMPLLELTIPRRHHGGAVEALTSLFDGHVACVGRWMKWTAAASLERVVQALDLTKTFAGERDNEWRALVDQVSVQSEGLEPPLDAPLESPRALAWLAGQLEGRARTLKVVPDQFTFCVGAIDHTLPCERDAAAPLPVVVWDAKGLEGLGFGRIGFTHDPLLDLLDAVGERRTIPTPRHDQRGPGSFTPETARLLADGRTQGIAPLEPPTMRRALRQRQPTDLASLWKLVGGPEKAGKRASFARVVLAQALATAKAHDPLAFFAAALTQSGQEIGAVAALLAAARQAGFGLQPLDLNCSAWEWMAERRDLRPGLMLVRDLTPAAGNEIEQVRSEGPFQNLADLLRRTDPRVLKTSQVEALIKAGALDGLHPSRASLLIELPILDGLLRPRSTNANGDPLNFFGRGSDWWLRNQVELPEPLAGAEKASARRDAENEREATGLVLSMPPDREEASLLKVSRAVAPEALTPRLRGSRVCLLSAVFALERTEAKAVADVGGEVGWVELGGVMARVRHDQWATIAAAWGEGASLMVTGLMDEGRDEWVLDIEHVAPFDDAMATARDTATIEVDLGDVDAAQAKSLAALVARFPGRTPLRATAMPARGDRALGKLVGRQVAICPPFLVELTEQVGSAGWRLVSRAPEGTAAESARMALRAS